MLSVKTAKNDYIAVPENLLEKIGIEEGDAVNVRVNKGTLVITKEKDSFLALEEALKDVDFESHLKDLRKKNGRSNSRFLPPLAQGRTYKQPLWSQTSSPRINYHNETASNLSPLDPLLDLTE